MQLELKDLRALADSYYKLLKPNDPRFANTVSIHFRDESYMTLQNAFLIKSGSWIYVFTVNYGHFEFDTYDLVSYHQSLKSYEPIEELNNGT